MAEKFTSQHFVDFVKKFAELKLPYWYGTCVYKCTKTLLNSKTNQYPDHYTKSRMSRYNKDIAANRVAADCVGLMKGYAWTNGGEGVLESVGTTNTYKNSYGSNGCPDTSANGMFEYAKKQGMDWGSIESIPEIPGIAVRMSGHVGYYIGGGKVVEERGFNYGTVITDLKSRPWTHWYKIPFIKYIIETPEDSKPIINANINVILRKGKTGDAVKELQLDLIKLGYSCGHYGADGDFGRDTLAAVKAFQEDYELEVDGEVGPLTWGAIEKALRESDLNEKPVERKKITINSGSWNIRTAPSYDSKVRGYAHGGDTYELVEKLDGWYVIMFNDDIAYIGQKAVKQ